MKVLIKLVATIGMIGLVYLWAWISGDPPYQVAAFFALGGVVGLALWDES